MQSFRSHTSQRRSRIGPQTLLWGGLFVLIALGTLFPIVWKENHRALKEATVSHPFSSLKHQFLGAQTSGQSREPVMAMTARYDDDDIPKGTLTNQPSDHFRAIQRAVDRVDLETRCGRYGFGLQPKANSTDPAFPKRRIFYGSLIANEPWELLEIIAAETHGIFAGMILVESNRTQTATPRPFLRKEDHLRRIAHMFGTPQIQLRRYVNEDTTLDHMTREHRQRQEILKGWKELGMEGSDIGYIADIDETFTRDFLRAVQTCPYVAALDYDSHHCFNPLVKIAGYTRIFESSPECITKARTWYHPDMILGACVELIGNETMNPLAPRERGYLRAKGFAHNCETRNEKMYKNSFGNIDGDKFPLWSAADFRRQCGGHMYELNATGHAKYTAFHFHNFFADFTAMRQKYSTYGHPVKGAFRKRLEAIGDDLKLMVRCVQNWTDAPNNKNSELITETQQWQRELEGYEAILPPMPIYFSDADYRRRKHMAVQEGVASDERGRQLKLQLQQHEVQAERLQEEANELKRKYWRLEAQAQALRRLHI